MKGATAIVSTSILSIITFAFDAAHAEEILGWKISWSAATEQSAEIEWDTDMVSHVETHRLGGSESGQSQGSYLLDSEGYVIEGGSDGFSSRTFSEDHLGWPCGVGDSLQYVDSHFDSSENETFTGPEVGDYFGISEYIDGSTGAHTLLFGPPRACTYAYTTSSSTFNPGTCEPQNSTLSDVVEQCVLPFTASPDEPVAEDETNTVFSSSGSRVVGWIFSDESAVTGYPGTLPVGPIVKTWDVTAEKIVVPSIHGIELTQAIQVYQQLDQFRDYLAGNDGNPPVPLVAYKPLAVRVALERTPETVDVIVEAYWNGGAIQSPIRLTQSSACFPPDTNAASYGSSRENPRPDCRTADFYVMEPGPGMNDLRIVLRTDSGDMAYEERLAVRTKVSDSIVVGPVNICSRKTSTGLWDCLFAPVRELERGVRLMREIYPTDQVSVVPTGQQIRLEVVANQNSGKDSDTLDCYDWNGREVFGLAISADGVELTVDNRAEPLSKIVKCESDMWWYVAAERVERLYAATNRLLEWKSGLQWLYFGVFKWDPLHGPWSGQAADIPEPSELAIDGPARGAIGAAGANETERDVKQTVAHEIGHLMGRRHTNLEADKNLVSCSKAPDSKTDYPATYPDSGLWSGDPIPDSAPVKNEIGFHVKRKSIRDSRNYFDIMSYCSPNWITPFTYKKLHEVLDPPPTPPPGEAGSFWLISGFISGGHAYLDAIYGFDTIGPVEEGSGNHRIEVRDVNGDALFVRRFSPNSAQRDPMDPAAASPTGLSFFAQLVPVVASAANIVLVDEAETVIAEQDLSGTAPAISITFPNGGEQLDGAQSITWSVTDPDTNVDEIFYWLQYSQDGGNSWINLAQDVWETSVEIDFDQLPGSQNALLRVLGTDGVNTGAATSAMFSVTAKMPTAEIALPENGQSEAVGDIVFFEGYGYDLDDGLLPGNAHEWSSDRDGHLATGNRFSTSNLSQGTHVIELLVIDGDGNTATDSVVLNVGDSTDSDGDGVPDAADNCPATPMGEPVDANGCSASQLDTDGDGVSDANDRCPGTPAGTAVDSNGCVRSQPTPSASGGGSGGGGTSFAWVLFLCYWALVQSRRRVRLEITAEGIL